MLKNAEYRCWGDVLMPLPDTRAGMTADERADMAYARFNLGAPAHTVIAYKKYIADAIREAETVITKEAMKEFIDPVNGLIYLRNCIKCQRNYPEWSVSSFMECCSCKVKRHKEQEREACAAVADEFYRKDKHRTPDWYNASSSIADAIRARKASHD